ncbi:Nuclear pore complex protein [Sesamum angolense]|uniref:Nuclear pore complex protein n=1 Tax=Sesamum angolense TaxID=2727404 RepID=A0AAE2BTJ0_9LAMI|nr:Nuclear pore complex protein [Sesamum angolense]
MLLIDNISRPAPNITHLLLKFDVDGPVERTLLQPKFHYSCLKVILDMLDKLSKPDVNALLHEFGFQHLNSIGVAPLPKRNCSQALRISSLHQRAWLLKLLAVVLHSADMIDSNHREACQSILNVLFGQRLTEFGTHYGASPFIPQSDEKNTATVLLTSLRKVLELLEVIQFESPDITLKSSQFVSSLKYSSLAEDILTNPSTSGAGIYYHSERGDRLIDLASFRDSLWQKCNLYNSQLNSGEAELNEVREAIQQLLRWGWKYNKNLEEQAAQLHMLTSWSQIVEVSVSRGFLSLKTDLTYYFITYNAKTIKAIGWLLDASLNASGSPDCSLKMAQILTQVALTCMAKLRDERFVFPSGLTSDTVTCLDIIMTKQLSTGACHSILFKLIMAILRHESSEALRRRQYALLLSYFQYCRHMLDSDVPTAILQFLSVDEQDDGDFDLEKIDKDQAELADANFAILRKEDQAILNLNSPNSEGFVPYVCTADSGKELINIPVVHACICCCSFGLVHPSLGLRTCGRKVIKDATQGSESVKTMSLYVLDALICVDHEKFFLSQLQSRGFLRACFMNISNFSYQDGGFSLDSMQRLCTLEATLSLLLRISHKYGKSGSEGNFRHLDTRIGKNSVDFDKQRMVVAPVLRFVFSLTSLVDTSEFFEVKNKIVREIIEFIKGHQMLFDQILQEGLLDADELTMELVNIVVGILCKVWPYEESDEYGFIQGLFGMMRALFCRDPDIFTSIQSGQSEIQQKADVSISRLCFNLSSYLYFLVTKKSLKLQVSDSPADYRTAASQQPTLALLVSFLGSLSTALERAAEEKYLLLNKIKDINELSRQEVDEIINVYGSQDCASSSENIQKRRYIAMVSMCRVVGQRSRLIMLLLLLAQNLMNIILGHFQDSHSMKVIAYDTRLGTKEGLHSLCGELIPVLERLELLSEKFEDQTTDIQGNSVVLIVFIGENRAQPKSFPQVSPVVEGIVHSKALAIS